MTKKTKSRAVYRFDVLEGSRAIQRQPLETERGAPSQRMSTRQFLSSFSAQARNLPKDRYPHRTALVGWVHALCDQVSALTAERLKQRQGSVACASACDACCYYTDMDCTGIEFEEMIGYIKEAMPDEIRRRLLRQVTEEPDFRLHGHQPCPFLDRTEKTCGIYPVRPMGCRGLLATKRCRLDVEEDTGLAECVMLTQEAWKAMPIRGGILLIALEHTRQQKGHFNLKARSPEILVQLKQIESDRLARLLEESLDLA